MSKSTQESNSARANALESQAPRSEEADRPDDKPARRYAPSERDLFHRILNTPHLEQVIPRLQPEVLHRALQKFGLEDCGELVSLATPEQLARVFDLDLWRAAQPGLDEQFDADRFGVWLEVLLEFGAEAAARKLAGIDAELVITGVAQHALVFDRAAVSSYETLEGVRIEVSHSGDDGLTSDIGGYALAARRTDSWEAIVEVLMSLEAGHSPYFHQVMRGCRMLSNSRPEADGLHDLCTDGDQTMFDLAVDRERRREKQGYVTPAQARAFLQMARRLQLQSESRPSDNPLARAYFRAIEETAVEFEKASGILGTGTGPDPSSASSSAPSSESYAESIAEVNEVLTEAGVLAQQPKGLLGGSQTQTPRLGLIQACMQFALDRDPTAFLTRTEEIVFLAKRKSSFLQIR